MTGLPPDVNAAYDAVEDAREDRDRYHAVLRSARRAIVVGLALFLLAVAIVPTMPEVWALGGLGWVLLLLGIGGIGVVGLAMFAVAVVTNVGRITPTDMRRKVRKAERRHRDATDRMVDNHPATGDENPS